MRFDVVTLFPEIISSYLKEGVLSKGLEKGLLELKTHDLRQYGVGNYNQVDDRPFGGGAGMVLMFEPIAACLGEILAEYEKSGVKNHKVIATSAKGKTYKQSMAKDFAGLNSDRNKYDAIIILCGRYEGFDQRIIDELVDEEISVGNFVLTGGELPALIMIDSISRLIPGVLGKQESFEHDSFFEDDETTQYPQYTRPDVIEHKGKQLSVPKVLLSGDHKEIEKWRKENVG